MYTEFLVPYCDGEKFNFWAIKMKHLLITKGIWDITLRGYEEPKS